MSENDESKNDSKGIIKKLEEKIANVTKKVSKLENENAVLTDKVESKADPNEKPIIIRRGYVKPGVGFQKNKDKVPATINVPNKKLDKDTEK